MKFILCLYFVALAYMGRLESMQKLYEFIMAAPVQESVKVVESTIEEIPQLLEYPQPLEYGQ